MRDVAQSVAELIDDTVAERAVVLGSLPPDGRDLDLLVRSRDEEALAQRFERHGMLTRGGRWILFENCSAYRVELARASDWHVPAADDLFAAARPIAGFERLVRPAPHHALVLLAVRVAAGRGVAAKQLTRAAEAQGDDPAAWERAREPAAAAGLDAALARLRAAVAAGSPIPPRRTRRLRRRGHLVAVSGLDGAGKSGQAWSLLDALEQTGHASKVVHVPLGSERVLWVVGGLAHRAVSWAARHGVLEGAAERTQAGASILGDPAHPAPQGGVLRGALTHVWATFVAVANTTTLWRSASRHILAGRIVIHDRYTLDSIVRLQTLYGDGRRLRFQCWIVRRLSPRPLYSFFLDVAPETAIERKQDRWTVEQLRLQAELYRRHSDDVGARRIDGERPREEICAEIARKVWRRVGAS